MVGGGGGGGGGERSDCTDTHSPPESTKPLAQVIARLDATAEVRPTVLSPCFSGVDTGAPDKVMDWITRRSTFRIAFPTSTRTCCAACAACVAFPQDDPLAASSAVKATTCNFDGGAQCQECFMFKPSWMVVEPGSSFIKHKARCQVPGAPIVVNIDRPGKLGSRPLARLISPRRNHFTATHFSPSSTGRAA